MKQNPGEAQMPNTRDGNNNMANSTPATEEARYVTLAAQFRGLDEDYKDLKGFVLNVDRKIDTTSSSLSNKMELMVTGLGNKLDASITTLQSKFEERNRIQWPAMSVMVSVLALIGALVYWPIRESTINLRDELRELAKQAVYTARYESDRNAVNQRLIDLRETTRSMRTEIERNFERERTITDRIFNERSSLIGRNTADISSLLRQLQDVRETTARHEQTNRNLDARLDAISRRLAEHIRDWTRIDRPK